MNRYRCWHAISTLIVLATFVGCSGDQSGVELSENVQQMTLTARPEDAFVSLLDSKGDALRMPDGIQIVMDNQTYETLILPRLPPKPQKFRTGLIVINSSFSLEKRSIVIDVTQSPDGGSTDVARTYWTYRPNQILSVERPD